MLRNLATRAAPLLHLGPTAQPIRDFGTTSTAQAGRSLLLPGPRHAESFRAHISAALAAVCFRLLCAVTEICMHGAVYVIFGASGGIGSALAARLAKQPDASLVLAAESEEAIKQVGDVGGDAERHVVDAQKFDEACARQRFGRFMSL